MQLKTFYWFSHYGIAALSKFSAPTIAFLTFDWLKNSDYEPLGRPFSTPQDSDVTIAFPLNRQKMFL